MESYFLGLCVYDESSKEFIFVANGDCILTHDQVLAIAKHIDYLNDSPQTAGTYHINANLELIRRSGRPSPGNKSNGISHSA